MLEEYLEGPQVSTESLVVNGVVHTIGFSDRNYDRLNQYRPHIIEDGGDLPSFLPEKSQNEIKRAVEKTAYVLGIKNGVIKGDMVLSENKAFIIEVATRLSGGYFCSDEIPLNTGVDFVKQAIKLALGDNIEKVELEPVYNKAVSQRYLFPEQGIVKEVFIPDWIKENSNIKRCEIRVEVGDIIHETTHHPARAGVIIATGIDRKSAIGLAIEAIENIKIVTK
jgi:biotin carboxylase